MDPAALQARAWFEFRAGLSRAPYEYRSLSLDEATAKAVAEAAAEGVSLTGPETRRWLRAAAASVLDAFDVAPLVDLAPRDVYRAWTAKRWLAQYDGLVPDGYFFVVVALDGARKGTICALRATINAARRYAQLATTEGLFARSSLLPVEMRRARHVAARQWDAQDLLGMPVRAKDA